ncbi:APH(3')-II family aminoglycoside O-phosphotransferase (plasmid) [Delftia tsuruhatensis]
MSFPLAWQTRLAAAKVQRQTIGESGADVWRLDWPDGSCQFVKAEDDLPLAELPDEIERLRWMHTQGLPCPEVLDTLLAQGRHWLLMSAVPGRDLACTEGLSPQQTVELLASSLQGLHRLPLEACPFDHRLEHRLADARARAKAGLIDEEDFDDERQGMPVQSLLDELYAGRPGQEDLAVTHGDACLPNFMVHQGQFSGFIDCGRLGVADRYQDLALTARSIERNLGKEWLAPFFALYGVEMDAERIAFFCLLDEFF